ncbi:DUF3558 domain-containing protein [Nocardia cyriacigeorgica]|uniref:DUF3558 domain-containing protein n=1 Tax=Nocardia cyriacigeorgica TaxID=135487 RepID=A0A5R8NLB6_9NOCA|nr:DUF3558 domain-containing protein [Nocardia cyriacigeorgica]TLF75397.1 DUF3558 domain-containing protein [Nocardia cyriacigeorgica]
MARRIMMMLLAGAVVPGVVACGGSTEGSPTAEGSATSASAAPVELWDPCTGIPEDVIAAVELVPETKESGIGGVDQTGWEICRWRNRVYSMTVFSTDRPVAEFESKPGNVEFQDVTVAGRAGRQFKVEGASKDLLCDVLFPAKQGVVQLRVSKLMSVDNPEDPCAILDRVGASIVPVFPQ